MARLPGLCLASVFLVLVCCSEAVRLVPSSRSTVAQNATTGTGSNTADTGSSTANTGSSTGYADSATTTGAIARGINSSKPTRTRPKGLVYVVPFAFFTRQLVPKKVQPFDTIVFLNAGFFNRKRLYRYPSKDAFLNCEPGKKLYDFTYLGQGFRFNVPHSAAGTTLYFSADVFFCNALT
ncbi:unnamed protein product [Closterium sp. Yama58-4]|nr:unnamed protein product [Closterium sp. Yama58-4]